MFRLNTEMAKATHQLEIAASEIRTQPSPWAFYVRADMISQDDFKFISEYEEAKTKEERDAILKANTDNGEAVRTLITLMTSVSKEQNIRYVLTLIDDMIEEDKRRVDMFLYAARKEQKTMGNWFFGLLQRLDHYIIHKTCILLAKFVCYGKTRMEEDELNYYFTVLKEQLKNVQSAEYGTTTVRCLQIMVRIPSYRDVFVKQGGLHSVASAIRQKLNFQVQYQLIFTFWCMTFHENVVEQSLSMGLFYILGDILSEARKEKVIRIIIATFRNILESTCDKLIVREAALQMVQCKTLKTLEQMDLKQYNDDDLKEDVEYVIKILSRSMQDLSSFDEYLAEIKSGRLQWSPVHKSDKFWKENIEKFTDKNYNILQILIHLLEFSTNALTLCVAMHDVGEYVRYNPRGKRFVQHLNGKDAIMRLLQSKDPNVRYHALLATQKIMLHHWEYLGNQVKEESDDKKTDNTTSVVKTSMIVK